jgi:hypothetical protein
LRNGGITSSFALQAALLRRHRVFLSHPKTIKE